MVPPARRCQQPTASASCSSSEVQGRPPALGGRVDEGLDGRVDEGLEEQGAGSSSLEELRAGSSSFDEPSKAPAAVTLELLQTAVPFGFASISQ
jgi:hypothetical protein